MRSGELHIASLVVHAVPGRVAEIETGLSALAGVRVHASSALGRLVVTIEQSSAEAMTAAVVTIQQMHGVLSAALVYQCADSLQAMNQEMPDAQA